MATATTYRPAVSTDRDGRDGLGQLVRAEWTKLRSVRRWVLAMLAAAGLTILVSLLGASGTSTDANENEIVVGPAGKPVSDNFRFVHQTLSGDGSVTARVLALRAGQEQAGAGVMIKESTRAGSPYAALLVTSGGVRLRANFSTDLAGSASTAPRWLRLTRSGATITGYESADGTGWSRVGEVTLRGLPQTVETGLFVMSPPEMRVERRGGASTVTGRATLSTATFDNARVETAQQRSQATPWTSDDVGGTTKGPRPGGDTVQAGGTFTVTGSGDIALDPPGDDIVQISLFGAFVGMVAVVAVGVLFITSEYKRGMIRTTFAASPRRGRVLAAKTIVIGVGTFAVGLVASVTAFFLAQPILRGNGYAPPAFPYPSLSDWPVLRAVVGTAALLAVVAVFSLGVGAILRHSASAITVVIGLVTVPVLVAGTLPLSAAQWLMRLTPAGGLAIQRAAPPTVTDFEPWQLLSPWPGFAVLCGYAAAALTVALWLLRRRDA
jgi:ABC-type transport system involved in multi-copper enzyme maturation permease subunit